MTEKIIIKPGQRLTKQKQNPQRVNKTKAGSFGKINKIDKLLAKLTKTIEKRPKLIKLEMKIKTSQWISIISKIMVAYKSLNWKFRKK